MAAQPAITPARTRRGLAAALLCLAAFTTHGADDVAPDLTVHFTAIAEDGVPAHADQREFDCGDIIHAVLHARHLDGPEHLLEADWTDPLGTVRERTRQRFRAIDNSAYVWLWLRLHRPSGSALLQAFDPGAGMGEFMGEWTVDMRLDGRRIAREKFTVYC